VTSGTEELRLPPLAVLLASTLADRGLNFTHWKSNSRLGMLDGHEVELDLLIESTDRDAMRATLGDLGFRKAVSFHPSHVPDVFHYYGLESDGSCLVHAHVYHRVITGESLLKNYELPIQSLLLGNTGQLRGLPVPAPEIELSVFTLRTMIKHASFLERRLLYRDFGSVRNEVEWLVNASATPSIEPGTVATLDLPELNPTLVQEAMGVLRRDVSIHTRNKVARRVRRALAPYRRFGRPSAFILTARQVSSRLTRKILRAPATRKLVTGGQVIAFVGAEASGKSSLVKATAEFYGKAFAIRTEHFGKPPGTVWTAIPRLAVPVLRKLAPRSRPTRVEAQDLPGVSVSAAESPGFGLLMYAIRSVMLARERSALAQRASARAGRGEVVVCDRYPSRVVGAADSPRLVPCGGSSLMGRLYDSLVSLERSIYQAIVQPHTVIRLTVPLEDAVRRNEERIKAGKETEEYVRQRHAKAELLVYPGVPEYDLDTAGDLAATTRRAYRLVWDALAEDSPRL